MNIPMLSPRLQFIYDIAHKASGDGGRFIDVGSDHGYLSLHALNEKGYSYVIATDIHENPASKTSRILGAYGFGDVSEVHVTDGLDGVPLKDSDTVVMAGLGGNNMMDILTRVKECTNEGTLRTVTWCFQPQKTIEELRVFLYTNGFDIVDEDVCMDRGIYYPVVISRYDGKKREITLKQKYFGPVMLETNKKKKDEYFEYLKGRYNVRSRGDEEIRELVNQIEGDKI